MQLSEPQALNRAASYCSKAERCEYDVRKRLTAWEQPVQAIERIVKRLKDERFLSDERFCRSFINDKVRFNKWGRKKIEFELRKRSISDRTYKPLLDELSGDEFEKQLLHILTVKARSVKGKDEYDVRNKLLRFALGRGFAMDISLRCIKQITGSEYEEDV